MPRQVQTRYGKMNIPIQGEIFLGGGEGFSPSQKALSLKRKKGTTGINLTPAQQRAIGIPEDEIRKEDPVNLGGAGSKVFFNEKTQKYQLMGRVSRTSYDVSSEKLSELLGMPINLVSSPGNLADYGSYLESIGEVSGQRFTEAQLKGDVPTYGALKATKLLPSPTNQTQMAEYQRKKATGEYEYRGERWYESAPSDNIVDENEQARTNAANQANKNAKTIFDNVPGDDVDMRESTKILKDIQDKLEKTEEKIPAPISLVDLFKEQKIKLGIEPLETELSEIDSDIERINVELLVQAEEEGEKLISTREIGRAKGALQKRAEREIALLNVERSAVARILGGKIDTLNAIVKLTDMDYDNASDFYTKEYNRQIQLYNLVSGAEDREFTRQERARDSAQANLILLHNLLTDGNITYDALSSEQKLKINEYEAQAGFFSGMTAQIMADDPDKKIQTVTSRTDESGNTYFDVLSVDLNGVMTVKSMFRGKAAPSGGKAELSSIEKQLTDSKGTDGFVDPGVYSSLKTKAETGPDEFDKRFGHLLSLAERKKLGIKVVPDEGIDPVLLKDLQDAVWATEQGADENEIKRRFLEKHPKEEKLFNEYIGL